MQKIVCLTVCFLFLLVAQLQAQVLLIQEFPMPVDLVTFSSDGKKIVAVYGGTVYIWDSTSGRELQKFDFSGYLPALSPDGKRMLVSEGGAGNICYIWDVESGKELRKLEGTKRNANGTSAAFSPDAKKIVISEGDTVRIWDAESGKELQKLGSDAFWFLSVAFSPDGKKIVTAGYHRNSSETPEDTVRIWDAESGRELQKLGGRGYDTESAAFSPDGKKIVTTGYFVRSLNSAPGDRIVRILDAESGKELQRFLGSYSNFVPFSPDGKMVVAHGDRGGTRIVDTESGRAMLKVDGKDYGKNYGVYSAAFSPDGKRIVIGVGSGSIPYGGAVGIVDISTLPKQWADAQKRREIEYKAGNVDLRTEHQKSGLSSLRDFLLFGTAELRDKLQAATADPFDKAETQAKIDTIKAAIAQKKFFDEFYYTAPADKIRVEGNKSTFLMEIQTGGFYSTKVGEVRFPVQGVTGAFIDKGSVHYWWIELTVSGSTENIRDFVRNSDNYRVRVWFTNLRFNERTGATADVSKIEIIKAQ
jgi:Tol biopolymer transport system component